MEDTFSWIWSLALIAGPIALGLALAYAMRRRRAADPQAERRSAEATRAGYGHEDLRRRSDAQGGKSPPRTPRAIR